MKHVDDVEHVNKYHYMASSELKSNMIIRLNILKIPFLENTGPQSWS